MKHENDWKPSRFVMRRGELRPTKDRTKLAVASRLNSELAVACYNRWVPTHAHGALLDLGCGTVPFYELYRPHVEDIYCVDWSASAHDARHVDQACDLSQPLPIDDHSFDTIIISSVLEHLPEPLQLFQEMARVLRPGGVILLNVPFLYWVHEAPHDFYRYTEFALRRFADLSGLETEHLEPLGGAPYVLASHFAKAVSRVRFVGDPLAAVSQSVARLLIHNPLGRRVCDRTKPTMPSGYFLVARKPPAGDAPPC